MIELFAIQAAVSICTPVTAATIDNTNVYIIDKCAMEELFDLYYELANVYDFSEIVVINDEITGNPYKYLSMYHTRQSKLKTAFRQVEYWKRTRAQLCLVHKRTADIFIPEIVILIICFFI